MNGKRILFQNGFLRDVTLNDETFIANLFSEPDIDFYYVRQPQHRQSKDFTSYMVTAMNNKIGLYDVICSQNQVPVGLISAELLRDNLSGEICWNIGSAVLRDYRKKGFASFSLLAYLQELTTFPINIVFLDISVDNTSSIAVAKKCGFNLRNRQGFIDPQHPEVGLRQHWYKTIHDSDDRIVFFQKGNTAYKRKDYLTAIEIYEKALTVPCKEGSPLTDAQIYSNIGMAYSSLGNCHEAYQYLSKAKEMGLTNPSIEKELLWLRNNVGLY
jgi:RimJ/RimL family protein N-acetyltransferase